MKVLVIVFSSLFLSGCASSGFIGGAINAEIACYKKHGKNATRRRLCLGGKYLQYKIKKDYAAKFSK